MRSSRTRRTTTHRACPNCLSAPDSVRHVSCYNKLAVKLLQASYRIVCKRLEQHVSTRSDGEDINPKVLQALGSEKMKVSPAKSQTKGSLKAVLSVFISRFLTIITLFPVCSASHQVRPKRLQGSAPPAAAHLQQCHYRRGGQTQAAHRLWSSKRSEVNCRPSFAKGGCFFFSLLIKTVLPLQVSPSALSATACSFCTCPVTTTNRR